MTQADLWTRRYHPAPQDAVRLVCFPHAGGSASYFFPLSKALSPSVEVLAVQYPGRQDRRQEKFAESIQELADRISELLPDPAGRPTALFGHSMGATVAFEVARRLPVAPVRLFVSGRRSPTRHRDAAIHRLPDDLLAAELRRLGGTDPRILDDEELRALTLPVIRNDYRAVDSYRYRPGAPLSCPVTVLVGDSDPQATVEEARAWREVCDREMGFHLFPGGHFYLDTQQTSVIELISDSLRHAAAPTGANHAI